MSEEEKPLYIEILFFTKEEINSFNKIYKSIRIVERRAIERVLKEVYQE